ncbi:MAG: hypothetical protein EA350_00605 [Gemmatimonadales bacterium]|nr:MAG: hypothetical protein EA350_00605 [Gemmatimonadales bacterium]
MSPSRHPFDPSTRLAGPSPVDLAFRPAHYRDFGDPLALALNGISGQVRRDMVRDMLLAEYGQRAPHDILMPSVDPAILEERAEEGFRNWLVQCHGPTWLGGEFLPGLRRGEAEIARVVLASATMDVISLRARPAGKRYHYRVVDEYGTHFALCRKTSTRPLTLGQVVEVLETAVHDPDADPTPGGIVTIWWDQQWEHGYGPGDCTDFAWVESELYPGLAPWYAARAAAWRTLREVEDPGRGE